MKGTGLGTDLGVTADIAIGCDGRDLRHGRPQVSWTHNAGLGHAQAEDKIVPPQGHQVVPSTCRACFLGIKRVSAKFEKQ